MSDTSLSEIDAITLAVDSRIPELREVLFDMDLNEEMFQAVAAFCRAAFFRGYRLGVVDNGEFVTSAGTSLECPRCSKDSLRWTHSSWQCGHCRFKQGCCEDG